MIDQIVNQILTTSTIADFQAKKFPLLSRYLSRPDNARKQEFPLYVKFSMLPLCVAMLRRTKTSKGAGSREQGRILAASFLRNEVEQGYQPPPISPKIGRTKSVALILPRLHSSPPLRCSGAP
jgi:hypothetical protein